MCGVTPTFQKTWQNKSPSPRHKHIPNSSFVFFLNWNIYNTIYFSEYHYLWGLSNSPNKCNSAHFTNLIMIYQFILRLLSFATCYRLFFRMGRHSEIKSSSHRDFFLTYITNNRYVNKTIIFWATFCESIKTQIAGTTTRNISYT